MPTYTATDYYTDYIASRPVGSYPADDFAPVVPAERYCSRGHHYSTDFAPSARWCRPCASEYRRSRRVARAAGPNRATRRAVGERKFGVELEFYGNATRVIDELNRQGVSFLDRRYTHVGCRRSGRTWVLKRDGSLNSRPSPDLSGLELVSPPLRGEQGFADLLKVCTALTAAGAKINRTCGLHVHHEVRDLSLTGIKNVVTLYHNHQAVIDQFVPTSRRGNRRFCATLGSTVTRLRTITSLQGLREAYFERFVNVNVNSYTKYGTLEFRQHHGTVNYQKIRDWVLLGQALITNATSTDTELAVLADGASRENLLFGWNVDPGVRDRLNRRAARFGFAGVTA